VGSDPLLDLEQKDTPPTCEAVLLNLESVISLVASMYLDLDYEALFEEFPLLAPSASVTGDGSIHELTTFALYTHAHSIQLSQVSWRECFRHNISIVE
jgi:hypothetical protein